MKKLLILVLMILISCGLFAQARPSFDQIASGTGKFFYGSAAAPSMTFGSDPDTGIYRYSDNILGVSSAGKPSVAFESDNVSSRLIFANGTIYKLGTSGVGDGTFLLYDVASTTVRFMVSKAGNFLVNTTTDDGVNKLQVYGGIAQTASTLIQDYISAKSGITHGYKVTGAYVASGATSNLVDLVRVTSIDGVEMKIVSSTYGAMADIWIPRSSISTTAVIKWQDAQGVFATSDTASKLCVYWSGSDWVIKNNQASANQLIIQIIGKGSF